MSKYDDIKNPKDLLLEVTAHGLSMDQEDICRAQDIFGRAPISNLVELAGESYSTFYMILFNIWNWEDATRFYNEHTLRYPAKIRDLESKKEELEAEITRQKEEVRKEHQKCNTETYARLDAENRNQVLEAEVHDRDMTIMELKAKLYDLMIGKEGT